MSKSSTDPFKRIRELEAQICCLKREEAAEDAAICTTATYVSVDDAPTEVGVGNEYTVTTTIKGIDIVDVFPAGTLIADILDDLNAKYATFVGVFTVNEDDKLQMVVTENLEGCDLDFTAVEAAA